MFHTGAKVYAQCLLERLKKPLICTLKIFPLILLLLNPLRALAVLEPSSYLKESTAAHVKILPLGDSLTAGGYNLSHNEWHVDGGYRQRLWQDLRASGLAFHFLGSFQDGPMTFPERSHEGHSGWRTDELKPLVSGLMRRFAPDHVLFLIGTNDIMQNRDLKQAAANVKEMIIEMNQAQPVAHIFLASVIKTNSISANQKIQLYNNYLQNLTLQLKNLNPILHHQLHWVDMFSEANISGSNADLTDGVHPTPSAYSRMGDVWAKHMQNVGLYDLHL